MEENNPQMDNLDPNDQENKNFLSPTISYKSVKTEERKSIIKKRVSFDASALVNANNSPRSSLK